MIILLVILVILSLGIVIAPQQLDASVNSCKSECKACVEEDYASLDRKEICELNKFIRRIECLENDEIVIYFLFCFFFYFEF
jgi:hypothetical protein